MPFLCGKSGLCPCSCTGLADVPLKHTSAAIYRPQVRLNKRMYEASRFTAHGVRHYEMYFPGE